jgi:predicted AlkP superfamily pyrophosphatase or phosphodiesterase
LRDTPARRFGWRHGIRSGGAKTTRLLALASLACTSNQHAGVKPPPLVPERARELAPAAAQPSVVVAIIFDQLGSDTLLDHLDLLDERGAIRRGIDSGLYFERGVYGYANTLTAPGHAAVHTGAPPIRSGIDGNFVWDLAQGKIVSVVDDPSHPVFGREASAGVGPTRLRAQTVAEALHVASPESRILSVALKDRSAALSVGTAADLVLWYDDHLGRFTSSSTWSAGLPAWLSDYQGQHRVSELLRPWMPEKPADYVARLGPDAMPGEADIPGFGTRFPHRFDGVHEPLAMLPVTPMLSEYLIQLTEAAATMLGAGDDDVVDFIALSVSGTDAAGHLFGPSSWEYVDHLIKADRAVGAWLDRLAQSATPAVLITSDHGVAPLPEAHGGGATRLSSERLEARMERALVATLGPGPWVAAVSGPFVYLQDLVARGAPERARIIEVARAALLEEPGIREVWPVERVRAFDDASPLEHALRISVAPENRAALMFLTQPYSPFNGGPANTGTNHGTPYEYDRQVPLIISGPGIARRRATQPIDQLRVAATLARLLQILPPEAASQSALF